MLFIIKLTFILLNKFVQNQKKLLGFKLFNFEPNRLLNVKIGGARIGHYNLMIKLHYFISRIITMIHATNSIFCFPLYLSNA